MEVLFFFTIIKSTSGMLFLFTVMLMYLYNETVSKVLRAFIK